MRKDTALARNRLCCEFHLKYPTRPVTFEKFIKYIKIKYPLYLDNFNFIENEFYDDLKEFKKKENKKGYSLVQKT